jgi:hypothetical protein
VSLSFHGKFAFVKVAGPSVHGIPTEFHVHGIPRNSRNSHEIPNALLRVSAGIKKKEALDERDTAKERLNFHEMTCPTCIHQRNLHSVK